MLLGGWGTRGSPGVSYLGGCLATAREFGVQLGAAVLRFCVGSYWMRLYGCIQAK